MQLEIRFKNGKWVLVRTNMITGERVELAEYSNVFEAQRALIAYQEVSK